ncbi:MAG: homoserine dehydrogenase [Vicinamibacteria bacterium]
MATSNKDAPPRSRIALAGLGTVGRAVVRQLREDSARLRETSGSELELSLIFDRSHHEKDLSTLAPGVAVTDSIDEFLASPADIIVELIGGTDPADRIIREGLQKQKAVVTANKQLMAEWGGQYLELAEKREAYLGFEASVAGGIPILRLLRRSLIADRILSIRGILNGTCNFILSEMAETKREFGDVLAQAQELGYAEADPSLDISGRDTADKLTILAALAFGRWAKPEQVATQGISEIDPVDFLYANRLGTTIRMLGVASRGEKNFSMWVGPSLIDEQLTLSKISGVVNAVEVTGARLGSALFSGEGAGGNPTAVSVVADILNAARWRQGKTDFSAPQAKNGGDADDFSPLESWPFYIRFFIRDQPGIIAKLAEILARHQINIDSVLQESWHQRDNLPFVISVDPTPLPALEKALSEMSSLDFINTPPLALPILRR